LVGWLVGWLVVRSAPKHVTDTESVEMELESYFALKCSFRSGIQKNEMYVRITELSNNGVERLQRHG
jgi:hypothetical protein